MAKTTISNAPKDVGTLSQKRSLLLTNVTATASIYVDIDTDAGAVNGYEWKAADGPISLDLPAYERLSMVSAGADQEVRYLEAAR